MHTLSLQVVLQLLEQVPQNRMYLVQRKGPTSFVVKEDATDIERKVTIGSLQSCSCR